jgi:ABC-2 type transport system permease protein
VRSLIRTSAFVRKELVEILRQPRLVVTLVLGPFLILGLFGAGLRDTDPPVDYLIVAPPSGPLHDLAVQFAEEEVSRLDNEGVTTDLSAALDDLRNGDVDLVVEVPFEAALLVAAGEQAELRVYHDLVDPVESRALELSTQQAAQDINAAVARSVVRQGQTVAGGLDDDLQTIRDRADAATAAIDAGDERRAELEIARLQRDVADLTRRLGGSPEVLDALAGDGGASISGPLAELSTSAGRLTDLSQARAELDRIQASLDELTLALELFGEVPSEVLASPFVGVTERITEGDVSLTGFYAPAVIMLLVQHMLISFLSLSLVRESDLGALDLFRVAPVTAAELLLGKYVAYLLVGGVITALLTGLLVVGLGVPLRGSIVSLSVAAVIALAASVALGFLLAMLARTDSQAVQYAMLVLLASIFFSGFILSLERFVAPLDRVAYVLPATYGIRAFRDVMLRGASPSLVDLAVLGVFAVAVTALNLVLMRRRLRSA